MNRKLAIALLVLSAGSARADDITIDPTPFVSSKSRAQVQAELVTFKQSGVNPWSMAYDPLKAFRSNRTRSQVTAEYLAERHEVTAFTSEDSGSMHLMRVASRARHQQQQAERLARGTQ